MSEKSKFGAVIILAIVFAIGGLFGVGGTVYYLKQNRENRGDRSARTERSHRDIYRVQVDSMMRRLERSLSLSEEQIPLVREEVTKFGNAMMEVHESMRPQFLSLMEERSLAIERHLSEEQLATFREDRRKHRERGRNNHEGKKSGDSDGGVHESKSDSAPSACNQQIRCKSAC